MNKKPVNVASVPQLSPFRYPGGKTWFVPTFRRWITSLKIRPNLLIEPFAGGGIISLTALAENYVDRVLMVELDKDIAAVWQAVTNGYSDWIAERILKFDLTEDSLREEIGKFPINIKEKAFGTILKNRTYHGGILANGAGFLKYGENGKGIRSRWYPATLAKRFRSLNLISKRIQFENADGMLIMEKYLERNDVVFFIDPPYTAGGKKAGRRLYNHFELDHEKLFELCSMIKSDFLMTYDNAEEVKAMAEKHNFDICLIPMKNTHHAEMKELVIGKDLSSIN